jgi:hypothetical protein
MYMSYELTYKSLRVAGTNQTTSTVTYNWHQTKTADIVSNVLPFSHCYRNLSAERGYRQSTPPPVQKYTMPPSIT